MVVFGVEFKLTPRGLCGSFLLFQILYAQNEIIRRQKLSSVLVMKRKNILDIF